MRFTLKMEIGMEVSEDFMEKEIEFNDGVQNGDIKISDLKFSALDPDGEPLDVGGIEETELLKMFNGMLQEKAGAE